MLAATAAAAIVVAGCSPESSTDPVVSEAAQETASETVAPAGPADLQSVLLPVEEHPEGSQIHAEMPLREATARMMPGTGEPSGIVVMPRCVSYFSVIGGLEELDGWYQFGNRADGALFMAFVAEAPDENVLDLIRMRVEGCGEGFQTMQGWPPSATGGGEIVSSTLSFSEREVAEVPDAQTLGITQSISFHDEENELVRTIRESWQCTEGPCDSQDSMVLTDDVFIWVHEGGADTTADTVAAAMRERVGS